MRIRRLVTRILILVAMSRTIDSFFSPKKQKTSHKLSHSSSNDATKLNPVEAISSDDSKASEKINGEVAPKVATLGTLSSDSSKNAPASKDEMSPWRTAMARMEPSWHKALESEFKKPYFNRLITFLESEHKAGKIVYPPVNSVFRAFELCPLDKVKAVCVGQDPYHGAGQANGLAFSVARGVQIPPSLKNMIKEAANDAALTPKVKADAGHGSLESWAEQGVLMLNTCLTVRKGEANSHQKKGWEEFTDAVIRVLAKKEGLVYLMWGNPAATKCTSINMSKNTAIRTSHPSPLGAHKTDRPFIGSKCFSRCNTALESQGHAAIDWNL